MMFYKFCAFLFIVCTIANAENIRENCPTCRHRSRSNLLDSGRIDVGIPPEPEESENVPEESQQQCAEGNTNQQGKCIHSSHYYNSKLGPRKVELPWGVYAQMIHEEKIKQAQQGYQSMKSMYDRANHLRSRLMEEGINLDSINEHRDEIEEIANQIQEEYEEIERNIIRYGRLSLIISILFVCGICIYFVYNYIL